MKDSPLPSRVSEAAVSRKPEKAKSLPTSDVLVRKHLKFGWWSLLVFLSLGIVLEALHGFKIGSYLNVSAGPRRLMWTLAHAHGTLQALVHLAFACSLPQLPSWVAASRSVASGCLTAGGLLVPAGFWLGGWFTRGGDPGLGVILVPFGALLLLVGVFNIARATSPR